MTNLNNLVTLALAIIDKHVKATLKKEHHNCDCSKEHNTIINFNATSLSSSDIDDISHTQKRGNDTDVDIT
eukprot:1706627-Ditylum_brightwellii.AAC.1